MVEMRAFRCVVILEYLRLNEPSFFDGVSVEKEPNRSPNHPPSAAPGATSRVSPDSARARRCQVCAQDAGPSRGSSVRILIRTGPEPPHTHGYGLILYAGQRVGYTKTGLRASPNRITQNHVLFCTKSAKMVGFLSLTSEHCPLRTTPRLARHASGPVLHDP